MSADEHLGDLALDALRIGADDADARAHLAACGVCRARADGLAAEARAFEARFDPSALASELLATASASSTASGSGSSGTSARPPAIVVPLRPRQVLPRWMTAATGALTALAAGALLFLSPPQGTRTKGVRSTVELFVLDASDQPRAVTGSVDPHARLAVRVSPDGPRFVRVLWESSPGAIDALYPAADGEAWAISEPAWLAHTIELDGATDPEHLRVVACDAPFDDAQARARLESLSEGARIVERGGCDVHTIEVTKP